MDYTKERTGVQYIQVDCGNIFNCFFHVWLFCRGDNMITDTLTQYNTMPEQHYNPNAIHPAVQVLKNILAEMRKQIKNANSLPDFLEGDLISIKLAYDEEANLKAQLQAQIRTMRGIERMIVEQYPGVMNSE